MAKDDDEVRDGLVQAVMRSTGRTRDEAERVVRIILERSGVRDVQQFVDALRVLQAPEIGLHGNSIVEWFYVTGLLWQTTKGRALIREVFQRLLLTDEPSGPAQ